MEWPLKVRGAIFRIGVKATAMTSSSAITIMNRTESKKKAGRCSSNSLSLFRLIQNSGRVMGGGYVPFSGSVIGRFQPLHFYSALQGVQGGSCSLYLGALAV